MFSKTYIGKNVMVFDVNGGRHDVTSLTTDNGAIELFSTSVNTHAGVEGFD